MTEQGAIWLTVSQAAIRLADQLLKLEREFGLTPSARAGLARPKDNPNENRGKDRFFKNTAHGA